MARKKKITCSVCGRSFDTGQGYAAHSRAHKRNGETVLLTTADFQATPTLKFNGPTLLSLMQAAREQLQDQLQRIEGLIDDLAGEDA